MSRRHPITALVMIALLAGCVGRAMPGATLTPGRPVPTESQQSPAIPAGRAEQQTPTAPATSPATGTPAVPDPSPTALGPSVDQWGLGIEGRVAQVDPEGLSGGGSGAGTDRVTPGAPQTLTIPQPADQPTATGQTAVATALATALATVTPGPPPPEQHPMSIVFERQRSYPGSEITIEQTLTPGSNYSRYIVSYLSDGLKIYGLMTVPSGPKPASGWPVVLFNHGYIPPAQYVTTERYVAYVDAFARAGYIVFKSDYRGHGKSEGKAAGSGEGSPDYTTDVLNALTSLKSNKDADPNRIGSWGHSMGGQVTLRSMVISKDIKAGVIWAGVVCSYGDMLTLWNHPPGAARRGWRPEFIAQYGTPEQNRAFWAAISPNSFLAQLSGPLQLHHGTADEEVPPVLSERLKSDVLAAGKSVEMFTYAGDNHNISVNFSEAMARSVAFMDKYVKGE